MKTTRKNQPVKSIRINMGHLQLARTKELFTTSQIRFISQHASLKLNLDWYKLVLLLICVCCGGRLNTAAVRRTVRGELKYLF